MVSQGGNAAHLRRLGLASTVAVATLLVSAGDPQSPAPAAGFAANRIGPLARAAAPLVQPESARPAEFAKPAVRSRPRLVPAALAVPFPAARPAPQPVSSMPPAPMTAAPAPALTLVEERRETPRAALAIEIAKPTIAPADAAAAPAGRIAQVQLATASAPAPAAQDDGPSAYIPQISDGARAAYIAQVDAGAPGQRMAVRSDGKVIGAVQFQVADGVVSVRVGQVLDLFEGRMDSAQFAALRASPASQEYVSLDQLHSAGIPLEYNAAYDELTLAAG